MKTLHQPVRSFSLAALLLGALLPSNPAWAQPLAIVQEREDAPAYLAGSILVQFNPQATDAQIADALQKGQLGLVKHLQTAVMKRAGHPGISHLQTRLPVPQVIQALKNHPAVAVAEPNWIYTHQFTGDPYFDNGSLWGMYGDLSSPANAFGSQAAEAWTAGHTGSREIVVGVIDEGMQVTHPDLAANIWTNPGDAADGVDNDGNGLIDDLHGWDFYNDDNSVYDGTSDDHGTHVTGTIGAVGGNDIGVVGVNWAVSLISGKFLGPTGGSTLDAIDAVDYFTDLKSHGVNIVALNNSWGGGAYSELLHAAIIRAAKADILFVAAAGNGDRRGRAINIDTTPYYPACYDTSVGTSNDPETAADYDAVIAVTAIDNLGNKASWANYGLTQVDLGAPGVSINSTLPDNTYGAYSGTSMATPHVTGAIALYASTHPDATPAEIKRAILDATVPTPSLDGKTVTGGRLDLSTVITPTTPPPTDPPPTVAITDPANNTEVAGTVTITATATDGPGGDPGVTQVEFFVGEASVGVDSDSTDGWSAPWDTTPLADGSYTLKAVATDKANQTATSPEVRAIVNNHPDTGAVIVPSGYEDVEANNWGGTLQAALRIQQVYSSTHFAGSAPVIFRSMSFRLEAGATLNKPITILVRLSTTAALPDKLNSRFSSNVGADVKQVFNGQVTATATLPSGFDIPIPFAENFTFDPTKGNLLVDITTSAGAGEARVDAAYVAGDGASRIFATNPYATKAAYADTQADVIRLELAP